MRRSLAALVIVAIAGGAAAETGPGFAPIAVRTEPIATFLKGSDRTRFGMLAFRGGLALYAQDERFGSLSGLAFGPGGTLYAVADTGYWFSARTVETDGRLAGIANPMLGRMRIDNGAEPKRKRDADAEGLRIVERGGVPTALVSFEGTAAVRAYAGPDFAAAIPTRMKLPSFVKNIRSNKGLEAIAVAPADGPLKGAIVLLTERSLDDAGNHRAFILSGPRKGTFSVRRTNDFDVSDATFLPGGDLIVLERKFSFSDGFAIRIRRMAASSLRPGATVDGAVLIEADERYEIDNLEGIALRTDDAGETLLTLTSDDNQNILQRTLLLQFALIDTKPPLPRLRPK